jgi:hypothetical protein
LLTTDFVLVSGRHQNDFAVTSGIIPSATSASAASLPLAAPIKIALARIDANALKVPVNWALQA